MSNWIKKNFNEPDDTPSLISLNDKGEGLLISCSFKLKKSVVFFEDYLLIKTLNKDCLSIQEISNLDESTWFFIVEKSKLSGWFNEESYSMYENLFQHFAIVTQKKIIHILSSSTPQITDLKN